MSRITKRTTETTDSATTRNNAPTAAPRAHDVSFGEIRIEYGGWDHILLALDRLNEVYRYDLAPADIFATGEPLDGLILTLLSQNTNDRNRDVAYAALRAKYPSWREVSALTSEEIANLIRPAGLGDTKALRMRDILTKIYEDFGDYSLIAMSDWSPERVREYLTALPGIGPKTVACVMVFDLNMPAFPVDTHVARVSKRLGWSPPKQTPERIQEYLEALVPAHRCRGGHLNMIEHGRKICDARKPKCEICNVSHLCKSYLNGEDLQNRKNRS